MGATRRSTRKLTRHGAYGGVRRLHVREQVRINRAIQQANKEALDSGDWTANEE